MEEEEKTDETLEVFSLLICYKGRVINLRHSHSRCQINIHETKRLGLNRISIKMRYANILLNVKKSFHRKYKVYWHGHDPLFVFSLFLFMSSVRGCITRRYNTRWQY